MASFGAKLSVLSRSFHTTQVAEEIRKLARLRVVDNSEIGKRAMLEGKPPRCIHVYNKPGVGFIGDKVLLAIKGEKKKGILVGLKQKQNPKVPRFDSNNVVLINEDGSPIGTRIHVPIPHILRTKLKEKTLSKGADYTKLLAIASRKVPVLRDWNPYEPEETISRNLGYYKNGNNIAKFVSESFLKSHEYMLFVGSNVIY